jgi:Tfp pilus assembly protein PilN
MKVNFLSKPWNSKVRWMESIALILFIFIIIIFSINYILYNNMIHSLKEEINNIEIKLNTIIPEQNKYLILQKKIKVLEKEIEDYKQQLKIAELINDLGYIVPEGSVLSSLELDRCKIIISGIADNNSCLLQLIDNMKNSPYYVDVELQKMTQDEEINFQIQAMVSERGDTLVE